MKIQVKIPIIIFSTILITGFIIIVTSYIISKKSVEQEVYRNLDNKVIVAKHIIESLLQQQLAKVLATEHIFIDAIINQNLIPANKYIKQIIKINKNLAFINILDKNQHVITSNQPGNRSYDKTSDNITISAPIRNVEGSIGSIVIGIKTNSLLIDKDIFLVNPEGYIFGTNINKFSLKVTYPIELSNIQYVKIYQNYSGDLVIGSQRNIENTSWHILTERNVTEAFTSISNLNYLGLGFILIIISSIVTFFINRNIISFITELQNGLKEIERNNFFHNTNTSIDEINQLFKIINDMALRLKKANNKLETKVSERATELSRRINEIELQKIGVQNLAVDLRLSQQRYVNLVNSIDGIFWEAEPITFKFLFVSQQAERFTGYPTSTWLKQDDFWINNIHPDDKDWVIAYCTDATKNCRDHHLEYRMVTKDKQIVWLKDIVSVIVENNKPIRLFGIMFDITEQKQAEEKVAIFKRFMDASNEGMSMATLDHKIIYMNSSLKNFLDISDSTVDKNFFSFHPNHLQQYLHDEVIPAVMQTGQWSGEMQLVSTTGKIITTFENLFLLKDDADKPIYIATVISNITQRKQAEKRLRYTEEQLHKMFEEGPIGMVIGNYDFSFAKVNPAFCNMLGYTEAELLKLTVSDITYPEDILKNRDLVDKALNGEISFYHMEKRYIRKDGKLIWGNLAVSFFYNDAGKIIYFLGKVEDITARKNAEAELKEREKQLQESQRIAMLGQWKFDLKNNILCLSDEVYRILDIHPDDFDGTYEFFLNLVHPDDQYMVKQCHLTPFTEKTNHNIVHRLLLKDGTIKFVNEICRTEYDKFGKPSCSIGTIQDITKHKKIKESLQRFRAALDNSADAIFITDQKTMKFIDMNKAACDSTGYSYDELLSMGPQDIKSYSSKIGLRNILNELIASNNQKRIETIHQRKDGSQFPVEILLQSVKFADGFLFIASVRDITERKHTEEKLRESETYIRTIVENIIDGIITINAQGVVQSFNRSAECIFGYKAKEIIGQKINRLMPEPHRSKHDDYLEAYLTTGVRNIIGFDREVIGQRKDGSMIPIDLAISETMINEQKIFVGIIRDITERKLHENALQQAKEDAEAANRAKSEFLANMSHEIRTPMNAVIGFSDILANQVTNIKHKNYLNSIQTAGKSLLTLINDVLDLSKIEAGRLEIQYEPVNLQMIFTELQQIFSMKLAEKNLEFKLDIDPKLPLALFLDETRLRQILLNIMGNAIKFTDNGHVTICANQINYSYDKVDLIIAVEDTGIGIPQQQHTRIFESFQQQEGQDNRKYGGTGLGLSITKHLVEMMNGSIQVKSTLNKGSIFEIILYDVRIANTIPVVSENFKINNISFNNERILVVDDIKSNLEVITEYLSSVNLEVYCVEDGQQALLLAEEYKPDLILMDIRMPEMDGYEVTKYLKNNPKTAQIPVIALTASVTVGDKQKIEEYGFNGYLSKPINISQLINELAIYLNHLEKIETVAEQKVELNLDKIVDLPILKNKINNMPIWEEEEFTIDFDVITELISTITKLGNEHNIPIFIHYSDLLSEYIQIFDIDNINKVMKEFSELIKLLE